MLGFTMQDFFDVFVFICIIFCSDTINICTCTNAQSPLCRCGSRGGRAVTCLTSQAENPGSMPGDGYHIIHLFILYIHRIHHRPTGGFRKMASPCIRAVLQARKRTRVAVVEFHVSVSDFFLSFLSSTHAKCVNI